MTWFLLTLTAPFLYATANHIDKHLLDNFFQEAGVGTLLLFSALISLFALPLIYLADTSVLLVDAEHIRLLVIVGVLNTAVLWFYLLALQQEETTISIIYYQLVPLFAYLLGYFLLDEALSIPQILAMFFILVGTGIISINLDVKTHATLRTRTTLLMVCASLCWASSSVLFKSVALEENVWRSLFWENLTLSIIGVLLFLLFPSYRQNFRRCLNLNGSSIVTLNLATGTLYILGNIIYAHAYLLAPIALVLLTESFQPLFVLLIGIVIGKLYSGAATETLSPKVMLQKLLAIVLTGVGVVLLTYFTPSVSYS